MQTGFSSAANTVFGEFFEHQLKSIRSNNLLFFELYLKIFISPGISAYYRALPYKKYLRTAYWNVLRKIVLARNGNKCGCGKRKYLQVHHLNYDFIGEEFRHFDCLRVLCRGCHAKKHKII